MPSRISVFMVACWFEFSSLVIVQVVHMTGIVPKVKVSNAELLNEGIGTCYSTHRNNEGSRSHASPFSFSVLLVNVTVLDQNLAENDGREVEEQHVSVVYVRSSDFNEEIRKREDLFAFVSSYAEQNTRHSLV